jgi:hypothetical protein
MFLKAFVLFSLANSWCRASCGAGHPVTWNPVPFRQALILGKTQFTKFAFPGLGFVCLFF